MAYQSYGDEFEPPKPRNDAYTGLLSISFGAMMIACLLLLWDWYGYKRPDDVLPSSWPPKLNAPQVKAGAPRPKGDLAPAKKEEKGGDGGEKKGAEEKGKMDKGEPKEKAKMEDKGKEKMDAKDKDKDKEKDKDKDKEKDKDDKKK
jgi:hypothetical protein